MGWWRESMAQAEIRILAETRPGAITPDERAAVAEMTEPERLGLLAEMRRRCGIRPARKSVLDYTEGLELSGPLACSPEDVR